MRSLTGTEAEAALVLRRRVEERAEALVSRARELTTAADSIESAIAILAIAKGGDVPAETIDLAADLARELWSDGGPMPPSLGAVLDAAFCRVRLDRDQPVRPRHLAALASVDAEVAERDLAWVTGRWNVTAAVGRVWLATHSVIVRPRGGGPLPMDSGAIGDELPQCLRETGLLGEEYLPWPMSHERQMEVIRRAEAVFRFEDEIVRVSFIRVSRDRRPQMVPMAIESEDRRWEAAVPGAAMVQVQG